MVQMQLIKRIMGSGSLLLLSNNNQAGLNIVLRGEGGVVAFVAKLIFLSGHRSQVTSNKSQGKNLKKVHGQQSTDSGQKTAHGNLAHGS